MTVYVEQSQCLSCKSEGFESVIDLGDLYLNAFPLPGEKNPEKAPLHVVRCTSCSLVQLRDFVDPNLLYTEYWYRSGTNQTMRDALRDVVTSLPVDLKPGDTVVDIGSNDNTLLDSYPDAENLWRVGFEPSNIGKEQEGKSNILVINEFFIWLPTLNRKAKVVTAIAMFYGVRDPDHFLTDVNHTMTEDGLFVLQLAYLPSILKRNAFDGICHEHVAYYSLAVLEKMLSRNGLYVFDAKLVELNEGSIRLYAKKFPSEPSERLVKIREDEAALGLDSPRPYKEFAARISQIRRDVQGFLRAQLWSNQVVHGYGASTKGNTLLQYFGVTPDQLTAIWERQPQKWGRETVGTRIPIIGEEEGRKQNPHSLLVLPWHFADEFLEREKEYLVRGGRIVIPLPEFRIVEGKTVPA